MTSAAVQLDEETLILEIIAGIALPDGVRFKRLAAGIDWEGDPIWNVYFTVSKKIPLTKKFLNTLSEISTAVVRGVSKLGVSTFPMVHFNEGR